MEKSEISYHKKDGMDTFSRKEKNFYLQGIVFSFL